MTIKTKICGIKTPEILETVIGAAADYAGFVFFPKSPRNVSLAQAKALVEQTRGRIQTVALIVNAADAEIEAIRDEVKPDFFQLHGDESPERVAAIKALTNKGIIKAVKVASAESVHGARLFEDVADIVLFDAFVAPSDNSLPGGNGVSFEWTWLKNQGLRPNFMLSGGLNPDNVHTAIQASGAAAVDVSSGVEEAPGQKSAALIEQFIANARA